MLRTNPFPNFLIIGAMKGGTTSLYHYLRAHPQIFMPRVKELDYFVAELNWRRGSEWYRRHFERAGPDVLAAGEASTNYTKYPRYQGVPELMSQSLPSVRLIYVVRNPIDRMRSHYQHSVAIGLERKPIGEALLETPSYIECSKYGLQIEQYLKHFPPEQLLIITSEDLRGQRSRTMRRVYGFLNVDDDFSPENLQREYYKSGNRRRYSPQIAYVRKTLKKRWPQSKVVKEIADSVGHWPVPFLRMGRKPMTSEEASRSAPPTDVPLEVRTELESMLTEDIRRLRAYMPEDFDGWGIR